LRELLASPTEAGFETTLRSLGTLTDWGIAESEVLTRFMELDEWTWIDGEAGTRPALTQFAQRPTHPRGAHR
jgi:hypothetical protein